MTWHNCWHAQLEQHVGMHSHLWQQLHGLIKEVDAVCLQEVAELLVQACIARGQLDPGLLVCWDLP